MLFVGRHRKRSREPASHIVTTKSALQSDQVATNISLLCAARHLVFCHPVSYCRIVSHPGSYEPIGEQGLS